MFIINILPEPKQSCNFGKYGAYPKKADYTRRLKKELGQISFCKIGKKEPVSISVLYVFPLRKSDKKSNWHVEQKDLDNLIKPFSDALNDLAYCDDGQVCVYENMGKIRHELGPAIICDIKYMNPSPEDFFWRELDFLRFSKVKKSCSTCEDGICSQKCTI